FVQLVAPNVHPIGAVSERVGSGNQDKVGMASGLWLADAVGHGKVSVRKRLVDNQQHVRVSGVDFVKQEDSAFLIELHKLRALVLEPSTVPGRNQASCDLALAHSCRARDGTESEAQGNGDLL